MPAKLTQEVIIQRIKKLHGNIYDLSLVNYKNRRTKIELVCKKHGGWMTLTEQLFRGQGCPVCGKKQAGKTQRIKFDDFVKRANKIHQNFILILKKS